MKVHCFNIDWDTEGETLEACGLPTECDLEVLGEFLGEFLGTLQEHVEDCLSEKYGFLLYGCEFEVLEK